MTDQLTQTKCFCNVVAMEKGIDPVGSAGNFQDAVIIEQPLPWKYSYAEMGLPQEMMDLLELWMQRYRETGVYGHRPLLIAPDPEYSETGFRRVIFYSRAEGLFAEFDKVEYLVPDEQAGQLILAWYEAPEKLAQYDAYRQLETQAIRDILICTHGAVDVACAKFGYPLYKALRDTAADDVRIWRVSHFGGHLYAPTLMDMPKGDYWAYVDHTIGAQIVQRDGNLQDLQGYYRGWAGLEMGFMQAMERACLMQEGWIWQSYPKEGEIVAKDEGDEAQWADVRIRYITPDNMSCTYRAHVRIEQVIMSNPSSNDEREYPYPQFVVENLESIESVRA